MSIETIGLWAGFILTLMVFSYLLGDNFLYRLAVYAFAGLTAGYVTMITVEGVILPYFRLTLLSGGPQAIGGIIPIVIGLLLFLKSSRRFSGVGNLGLALLIGVGTAVAVVGSVSGTLLPITSGTVTNIQQAASVTADNPVALVNAFVILLGVVCTLIYFQYLARRQPGTPVDAPAGEGTRRRVWIRSFSTVGQGFIIVTLGALYGGAILTGLTIFSERIAFLVARITGG